MQHQVRGPRLRPGAGIIARRRGVFGGAFNPPHLAHLICAQEARWQLGLDEVLMVPMGTAPHRSIDPEPGPQVRVELCRAAAECLDWLSVSEVEVGRDGPSYTSETLALLASAEPDTELTLILGADQAATLRSWHEPETVLAHATVAVAAREGMEREAVLRHLDGLGDHASIAFFEMPRVDISSTLVRERIADGVPVGVLVPGEVGAIVERRGLYRSEVAAR